MTDAAEALRRWIRSGGHWEVLGNSGDQVTVGLFTCDGGEEMDRLMVPASELPAADVPPAHRPDVESAWLPASWKHPTRVPLTHDHHLRPMGPADVDLDLPAVMSSRERLWSIYGEAWGWPPEHLDRGLDIEDLAHHEAETEAHESFLYGLFDTAETELLGCLYIDPPAKVGADADISWWVVDRLVGSELEAALDAFVPAWIAREWPLRRPRYVGRDLSWQEWLALPDARPQVRS